MFDDMNINRKKKKKIYNTQEFRLLILSVEIDFYICNPFVVVVVVFLF